MWIFPQFSSMLKFNVNLKHQFVPVVVIVDVLMGCFFFTICIYRFVVFISLNFISISICRNCLFYGYFYFGVSFIYFFIVLHEGRLWRFGRGGDKLWEGSNVVFFCFLVLYNWSFALHISNNIVLELHSAKR